MQQVHTSHTANTNREYFEIMRPVTVDHNACDRNGCGLSGKLYAYRRGNRIHTCLALRGHESEAFRHLLIGDHVCRKRYIRLSQLGC